MSIGNFWGISYKINPYTGILNMEADEDQSKKKARKRRLTRKDKVPCLYCGELGHLPKNCKTATDEQKMENYSYPTTPIKFKKNEQSIHEFKNRIHQWKNNSRKFPYFTPAMYQPVLSELLEFILWQCTNLKEEKRLLLPKRDIRLAFAKRFKGNQDIFI